MRGMGGVEKGTLGGPWEVGFMGQGGYKGGAVEGGGPASVDDGRASAHAGFACVP